MKSPSFLLLGIVGLGLIVGVYIFLTSPAQPIPEVQRVSTDPYRGSLSGVVTCLPHKDPNAPATKECRIALKTDAGDYYGINLGLLAQENPHLRTGEYLSAQGLITPIENLSSDQWQKYNVKGIFSITDSIATSAVK